jgi:hypothetical protein
VFLAIVLVVSIVAGSISMMIVSALLLAILAAVAYGLRGKRSSDR